MKMKNKMKKKSMKKKNEKMKHLKSMKREEVETRKWKKELLINEPLKIKNTYGCEVVKKEEIEPFIYHLISKIGLPNPIKVPERKRGMTSSGKKYNCHMNVRTLTERYGGKEVLGYMVQSYRNKDLRLWSHSVWNTPENKLVDVTKKTKNQNTLRPDKSDVDNQWFIPITEISTRSIVLKDLTIPKRFDRFGYKSNFINGDLGVYNKMKWNNPTLKDLVGEYVVFTEEELISDFGSLQEVKRQWKEKMESSFSLPSLLTGEKLNIDVRSLDCPRLLTDQVNHPVNL